MSNKKKLNLKKIYLCTTVGHVHAKPTIFQVWKPQSDSNFAIGQNGSSGISVRIIIVTTVNWNLQGYGGSESEYVIFIRTRLLMWKDTENQLLCQPVTCVVNPRLTWRICILLSNSSWCCSKMSKKIPLLDYRQFGLLLSGNQQLFHEILNIDFVHGMTD